MTTPHFLRVLHRLESNLDLNISSPMKGSQSTESLPVLLTEGHEAWSEDYAKGSRARPEPGCFSSSQISPVPCSFCKTHFLPFKAYKLGKGITSCLPPPMTMCHILLHKQTNQ